MPGDLLVTSCVLLYRATAHGFLPWMLHTVHSSHRLHLQMLPQRPLPATLISVSSLEAHFPHGHQSVPSNSCAETLGAG
jgi:hypothetical protein